MVTAFAMYQACAFEYQDDYWVMYAQCTNVGARGARERCLAEALEDKTDAERDCRRQLSARRAVCGAVGGGRYDPPFRAVDFDVNFTAPTTPNPYFPLQPGFHWEYESADERTEIEVRSATKQIAGVTCVVVNDLVSSQGQTVEDTDDWIALAKNGDIYYCGEEVRDYEHFAGDDSPRAELVSIDGSFKIGRDGAKPGILMPFAPRVGQVFRQEFHLGNAEDVVQILATNYRYGQNPALDQFVPQALANLLCAAADCVVTKDTTPLEPSHFELKYYAPNIGRFLEINPREAKVSQLVGCNVDPRCANLPSP
jgi:hypothetical protein